MKSKFLLFPAICLAIAALFSSCKKDDDMHDDDHTHSGTGYIRLSFTNMFGDSLLELAAAENYVTANNDTFACTTFKYYVSNVKFTDMDGNVWSESESYHLVNAADANSCSFVIGNIPQEHYTSLSFMIGVDSARNISGTQTGALDPANDMFWTWSTGYIFAKLEGESPQSTSASNNVTYHIGGYSGQYAGQRTVNISFGTDHALVTETGTPDIQMKADVAEWFTSPNTISIATTSNAMMPGTTTASIADNYANMFSLIAVQN